MADLLLANQENVIGGGRMKIPSVQKRNLRNCPTSASKRQALQPITNIQYGKEEEVSLPAHLDPLLALPSSIPSFTFSFSDSLSFSSPEPMLISSPTDCYPFSMDQLENEELTSNYANDIYAHLRQSETLYQPTFGYMISQPDITNPMRAILIDWLVEVCDEFNLLTETLYLSVSYIDRYLSVVHVPRSKLQLVGVTCLYIAAKYEEIFPPDINEFSYITDDTYTKKEIVKMEQDILRVLNFALVQPTSLTFLMRYLQVSINSSIVQDSFINQQIDLLSKYLCELALQDAEPFLKYYPSVIASSSLCLARHTLNVSSWPPSLQYYSGYYISDIGQCIHDLHRVHSMSHCHPQQAIRQKYSSDKYFRIAGLKSSETLPF